MARDLSAEHVLKQLEKGRLDPFYLFYGPDEFRQERALNRIRSRYIPENARDFNLKIFYGEETKPATVMDSARSVPFLASNRLVIVRRVEQMSASALENFIPYLDSPMESSCLIFVSGKADFRLSFYKRIRNLGAAVNFKNLYGNQVVPWIQSTAKEIGLTVSRDACVFLHGLAGNQLRILYQELEKLYLRHGARPVGVEDIQELAIYSRNFTIFELMDEISQRRPARSLSVLDRYMEEEGKDSFFQIVGMLNRQIRLIFQARAIVEAGGRASEIAKKLKIQPFLAEKLMKQSKIWGSGELERALGLLYEADGRLKTGAEGRLVLENLVLSLMFHPSDAVS